MGLSKQEYLSILPFSSLRDIPDPGIEPSSLMCPALVGRFFSTSTTWKTPYLLYTFTHSSVGKESTCNAGDPSSIPGLGRSAGEGIGYPLQYSWASLMAQLVKIHVQCGRPGFDPWVGKIPWRRERVPTSVFWPGEFHELYSPCGCKELDATFTFL